MRRALRTAFTLGTIFALLLVPSVVAAQTPLMSIDRDADLSPAGALITISGSITCETGESFLVEVLVTQGDGPNQETAFSQLGGAECVGAPQVWDSLAQSVTGRFHKGKATVKVHGFLFRPDSFEEFLLDRTIRLR